MSEKSERIFTAITGAGDDIIEEAQKPPKKRRKWYLWAGPVAAVLALAILLGVFSDRLVLSAYAISTAEYARPAEYVDPTTYSEALGPYLRAVIPELLGDTGGENRICSPINIYMALSMLAEITDGDTRAELLGLLGASDIVAARERAKDVWGANYFDDGNSKSILANSLWLSSDISYKKSTLDTLAGDYYASSFRGEMGSAAYDLALQSWLNQETGGLLGDQTKNLSMNANTLIALASTVYFKGSWSEVFPESRTASGEFHAINGDVTCEFMRSDDMGAYYWGDMFSATTLSFSNGREMLLILPDEGFSPEELLSDGELLELLSVDRAARHNRENRNFPKINLSMPKFDFASDLELLDDLANLGVELIADPFGSDFSPLSESASQLFVSEIKHAARISVDEEGCTAAAYTVIDANTNAMADSDGVVDFTLDRPFIFAVLGSDGLPLFVGVVNDPTAK